MRKGGDFFNLIVIIVCAIFAMLAIYWVAAIAFAGIMLVFGLVSGVASRIFHWPVKTIAIPAAMTLQIGKSKPAAWLGIAIVTFCLFVCFAIIGVFHAPALRRIGQGVTQIKERLGISEKFDTIAGESIGYQRLERWQDWIWAEDVNADDTSKLLAQENNRIPLLLFELSARVNAYGRELETKIFEGEQHNWFIHVYWFIVAVLIPSTISTFLLTIYQLSARRLALDPGGFSMLLISLSTIILSYGYFVAFFLFPYVSHPYHTPGIPFWLAIMCYALAIGICYGVVRANQQILFSPESMPEYFAAARENAKKAVQ